MTKLEAKLLGVLEEVFEEINLADTSMKLYKKVENIIDTTKN